MKKDTLYYVLDPMCSWCWGFSKTWSAIKSSLSDEIKIHYVMGGLAPDSNEPMTDEMREYIQMNWRKIEHSIPGRNLIMIFGLIALLEDQPIQLAEQL